MAEVTFDYGVAGLQCLADDCDWVFDEPEPSWCPDWWELNARLHVEETRHVVAILSETHVLPAESGYGGRP